MKILKFLFVFSLLGLIIPAFTSAAQLFEQPTLANTKWAISLISFRISKNTVREATLEFSAKEGILWGTITQPGMEPFDFACQERTSFNKTIQIAVHDPEALDVLMGVGLGILNNSISLILFDRHLKLILYGSNQTGFEIHHLIFGRPLE
jgi:hypothetical protein